MLAAELLGHSIDSHLDGESSKTPFEEMEDDVFKNPLDGFSDDKLEALEKAFEDNVMDKPQLTSGEAYEKDEVTKVDFEDSSAEVENNDGYYNPYRDTPFEEMESDELPSLFTKSSSGEFETLDKAFEDGEICQPQLTASDTYEHEDNGHSYPIDEDFPKGKESQPILSDLSSQTSDSQRQKPASNGKYVDNGASPMRIAERFLKKNAMFKLNGGRMFLYGYRNKPCYTEITEEELCDILFRQYKEHFMNDSPGQIAQAAKAVRYQLELTSNDTIREFESRYVACRNAIIDLEHDCVIRHTPDILLRYYMKVDIDFNNSYCPQFDRFLNDMSCGRDEVITTIQQMIAYSVFPTAFKKAFFVMIGPPNSSKSVLGNFIQSLFCSSAVCNECLQDLGKNFRSGNYAEARFNFDGDLPNQPIGEKEVGILKKILGGERIMAEVKYQQSYATDTDCKFLFASNHKLIMRSPDDAFLFRMHIIPCDNVIEAGDMDLQLPEKLQQETTAVFTRIYHWYRELKANNYRFDDCANVGEYCKPYVKPEAADVSSVLGDFIDDCFEITGIGADFVSSETIVRLFKGYCKKNMIANKMPGFSQQFSQFVKNNYSDSVCATRRGKEKSRGYAGMIICIDPANYCDDFA